MEIKYLEKLKNAPKIREQKTKGVKESEISKIENRLKIKFPLAYREFLLLAGKDHGGLQLADGHTSIEILADERVLNNLKVSLENANLKIERPFWVISEQDSFEQFYFFYLDEDTEDPLVYGITYGSGDDSIIYSLHKSFSEFINSVIDKSILFAKRGY